MVTIAPSLLVFAKEPAPGAVKTRLAAAIGADRAAQVYRDLTAATLAHARDAQQAGIVSRLELWCAPAPDSRYFRDLATATGATLYPQPDGNLGARMAHAIGDALTRSAAVLLIGTDCPCLDAKRLALARERLKDHDAVLGPAEDGGFVLVGARVPVAFGAARWSSRHAYADTAAAFTAAGIHWTALPVLWDVDEAADLVRWELFRASLPVTAE